MTAYTQTLLQDLKNLHPKRGGVFHANLQHIEDFLEQDECSLTRQHLSGTISGILMPSPSKRVSIDITINELDTIDVMRRQGVYEAADADPLLHPAVLLTVELSLTVSRIQRDVLVSQ
jgi:hypothetical protein